MRYLSLTLAITMITACSPSAVAQDAPPIEGMLPIEMVIPDWEDRRQSLYHARGTFHGGRTYVCQGQEMRFYSLDDTGDAPVAVWEEKSSYGADVLSLPAGLLATLEDYVSTLDNEGYPIPARAVDAERWADGWLVALSAGEYGGGLVHIADDGEHSILDKENANDLLRMGDEMYVASGLGHMGTRRGAVSRFHINRNGIFGKTLALPFDVRELVERDGHIVARLSSGLVSLPPDGSMHVRDFGSDMMGWLPSSGTRDPLGFRSTSIGFLDDGRVWLGGENIIAVFDDLERLDHPEVYIPEHCVPDFGDPPKPPIVIDPVIPDSGILDPDILDPDILDSGVTRKGD